MSYCCQDKKYFSELCPACVEALTTFDPYTEANRQLEYAAKEWPEIAFKTNCECGSEKTGGPGHSHWCPKYEK